VRISIEAKQSSDRPAIGAALYTVDAVELMDSGPIYGREPIDRLITEGNVEQRPKLER